MTLAQSNLWSKLECGELTQDEFAKQFEDQCRQKGIPAGFSGKELLRRIQIVSARRHYLTAIQRLRTAGFKVGIITNDMKAPDGRFGSIQNIFSHFVPSVFKINILLAHISSFL